MLARFSLIKNPEGQNIVRIKDHTGMVVGHVIRRICQPPLGTLQRMRDMAFVRYNQKAHFLYKDLDGMLFIKTDCYSLLVKYSALK